jgi:fructose-1-phosphate kinase PfkB-like protein
LPNRSSRFEPPKRGEERRSPDRPVGGCDLGLADREIGAPVQGEGNFATRVNVIVSTTKQGQLRFNPPGPLVSAREWQMIQDCVGRALRKASALILSGSLPRCVTATAYARLIRLARACGVPVLLDCDGPALVAAVRAKPFLVKPNEHELAQWAVATASASGLRSAAQSMSAITGGWVFVTRGPKPALLINATLGFEASLAPRRIRPRNTVGAGDALLAAVAQQIQRGLPPERWLACGVKVGSEAAQIEAGRLPVSG